MNFYISLTAAWVCSEIEQTEGFQTIQNIFLIFVTAYKDMSKIAFGFNK